MKTPQTIYRNNQPIQVDPDTWVAQVGDIFQPNNDGQWHLVTNVVARRGHKQWLATVLANKPSR